MCTLSGIAAEDSPARLEKQHARQFFSFHDRLRFLNVELAKGFELPDPLISTTSGMLYQLSYAKPKPRETAGQSETVPAPRTDTLPARAYCMAQKSRLAPPALCRSKTAVRLRPALLSPGLAPRFREAGSGPPLERPGMPLERRALQFFIDDLTDLP